MVLPGSQVAINIANLLFLKSMTLNLDGKILISVFGVELLKEPIHAVSANT